ncbi:MAG: acyltransferase family protein [Paludibacteraceae bacterium]|nr:acyltransferase family protein [Paludibacteraceae bacterium]
MSSLNPTLPQPARNRRMDILRAITIVLVVIGHTGSIPGASWWEIHFPLCTYRLAIFLFASGYFFKDIDWRTYPSFVWRKTKALAFPLLGWNIVYACVATIFVWKNAVDYLPPIQRIWTFHALFAEPFWSGHQYIFNLATWFVGMLFVGLVVYGLIHITTRQCKYIDHLLLVFYFGIAVLGLYAARFPLGHEWLLPLHVSYALFFIHFGKYYRRYLEPFIERVPTWLLLPIILLFQYTVVHFTGIKLFALVWMNFEGLIVAPIGLAIAGILLWMRLCRIIEQNVLPNKLEKWVSESTWDIMTHHIFVKVMVAWLLIHFAIEPQLLPAYRQSIWFLPSTMDYWTLILLEVGLPVAFHYAFGWCKKRFSLFLNKKDNALGTSV